jgi:hypothetical protein
MAEPVRAGSPPRKGPKKPDTRTAVIVGGGALLLGLAYFYVKSRSTPPKSGASSAIPPGRGRGSTTTVVTLGRPWVHDHHQHKRPDPWHAAKLWLEHGGNKRPTWQEIWNARKALFGITKGGPRPPKVGGTTGGGGNTPGGG